MMVCLGLLITAPWLLIVFSPIALVLGSVFFCSVCAYEKFKEKSSKQLDKVRTKKSGLQWDISS